MLEKDSKPRSASKERTASMELYLHYFDNLCEVALVAIKSCREIVSDETDLSDGCLEELQEKLEQWMEE